MNATFPVEWKQIFKSLSVFMSVAIIVAVTLSMGIRFLSSGFNYEKTFEHMSFSVFLIVLVCIPVVSVVCSFLIALWFRLAAITIANGEIHGRSFWGMRNRIPLSEVTKLTPFSNNGINAIVVNSRYHGQIYISDKTEGLPELLRILDVYLPESERQTQAEQGVDLNTWPLASRKHYDHSTINPEVWSHPRSGVRWLWR